MTSFHDSMWTTASRDVAAEQHDRAVALASVALADLTPFLHGASSEAEFDQRLALVSGDAEIRLTAATVDVVAREKALAQVREDFLALNQTRVAARLTEALQSEARKAPTHTARCAACNERLEKVEGNWRHTEFYAGAGKGFNRSHDAHPKAGTTKTAAEGDGEKCWDCGGTGTVPDMGDGDNGQEPCPTCGGSGTLKKTSAVRKVALDLKNVGIVDKAGLVCKGTDPSGKEVKFKVTESEMAQLSQILYGDLAMNFSGVSIDESDIISDGQQATGSRHPFGREASGSLVIEAAWPFGKKHQREKAGREFDQMMDRFDRENAERAKHPKSDADYDKELAGMTDDDLRSKINNEPGDEDYENELVKRTRDSGKSESERGGQYRRDSDGKFASLAARIAALTEDDVLAAEAALEADDAEGLTTKPKVPHPADRAKPPTAGVTAAADWPKGDSPMFPGEKIPACPKCGSVDTSVRGVPGSDGRMGGSGGGGETIVCNACGHSSYTPAKTSSLTRVATVSCRKCTAGATPDGAACGYCDGAGALDATTAMIKAADGWEQGITAQSFLTTALDDTAGQILNAIRRRDPDGWSDEPTKADYDAFEQWVREEWGDQWWSRYHTNWDPTYHEAVNSDANGSDRYQKTTHPSQPGWVEDEWDEGKADQKTLDEGRAAKDRGPADNDASLKQSAMRTQAYYADLLRRLQRYNRNAVSLTYTSDYGVNTVRGTLRTLDDGTNNVQVVDRSGAVTTVPAHNVLAVDLTDLGSNDAPLPGDAEPGMLDWIGTGIGNGLFPSGATAARQVTANPYASNPYEVEGPGNPGSTVSPPPAAGDVAPNATPKSTKPRVAPSSGEGGYDPENFPSTDDGPHRPGPVDRSADTVLVTPAGEEAARPAVVGVGQFTAPPTAAQRREAKVAEISARVLAANPGMNTAAARRVAETTVQRFAGVSRG